MVLPKEVGNFVIKEIFNVFLKEKQTSGFAIIKGIFRYRNQSLNISHNKQAFKADPFVCKVQYAKP